MSLTKENSPPVVDRELTTPPFIVATVVMEKEFVFCQRSMLNTAYSVKAFELRLNKIKVRACTLSSVDTLSLFLWYGGREVRSTD